MVVGQTPWLIPPRASAISQNNNSRIALTTEQISRIARILDPTVEDELAKARMAWKKYQSSRERDAIYRYLDAVFQIVVQWKEQRRAKASSYQALSATKQHGTIRTNEPFAVVIYCTSDRCKVDAKTRSKWARALRYAGRFKPDNQSLAQFIRNTGGINACATQWSDRRSS